MQISAKGIEDLIELYEVRGVSGSYNYFLSDTEDVLLPLPVALPLQYTILEGKHLVETAQEGSLVKVSLRGGEIRSDHILEPLSNIKIQLTDIFDHEVSVSLYGKVLTPDGTYATSFPVRFTSVSPEAAPFLERLVASCHLPTTRSTPT
jgi:adenylate cyclase